MAISQLPQAPYRQDRKTFPTALSTDVIFSEIRDGNRTNLPEYGTPHPNTAKWPNHKLVYIKPVDIERNEIFEFFYAAERENQDLYNFSFGVRSISNREFRVVSRAYVTLREKFEPTDIAFGTPMPDVPEGTFDNTSYIFYDKQQQQTDEKELNSLFVIEVHNYVERSLLDDKLLSSKDKPNLTPEKFRSLVPTITTDVIVEGKAQEPTLTENQYSVSEDQINESTKKVRTISQAEVELPVNLPNGQIVVNDFGGVVATRKESLVEDGTPSDSGFGVIESSVATLGNGQSVKTTIEAPKDSGGNPLFPSLYGVQIDSRYGVPFGFSSQIISSNSEQGGLYYGSDGSFGSVEVQPKDQWHSTRNTTYLSSLPAPQVWYGLRRENLPDVLLDVNVIGTERYVAVPTWGRVPDGPLKSRTTRSFTHGPPVDFDSGLTRVYYAAEVFQAVIEYQSTSKSQSLSKSGSTSSGTSTGTSNNGSQSTSAGSSSGSSSTSGTSTSNSTSDTSGTSTSSGNTSSSGTSSSSGVNTNTGTSSTNGTTSSSGTSSTNGTTSSNGTSSTNGSTSSNGTSSTNGTTSSNGTSSTNGSTSSNGTSSTNGTTSSNGTSSTNGTTSSNGTSSTNGTTSSNGTSSTNGTTSSNGTSSTNGSSSSNGSSSNNSDSSSNGNSSSTTSSDSSGSTRDSIKTNKSGGYVWNRTPEVSRLTTIDKKVESSSVSTTTSSNSRSTSSGTSTTNGTSTSSGTSTTSGTSTSSGTSTTSGTSTSSGTSTTSGTSTSSGTSTTSGTSTSSGTSTTSGTSTSSGTSTTSGTSTSSGTSTTSGTSTSSGTSTTSGTSTSSGTSTTNGTSASSGTTSNTGQSVFTGTNASSGISTSTISSSGLNTSLSTGASSSEGSSSSTTTSTSNNNSTGASTSASASSSSSVSTSETETTNKNIFTLSVPKCLRGLIQFALPSGHIVVIPATKPSFLSGWTEVSRQSEYWRNGIWVTEVIEVYV